MFDKAKTLYELKKIQSALAKEVLEVESSNGSVTVRISGEQKIKGVKLDPTKIDFDDIEHLEKQIESAVTQAIARSQELAADKMKDVAGGLGLPGL
jgi:DNA-binding YbaB/EbfC family protein